jgi:serine/threonine protein kinase/Flp pilus assembly protein TadD
MSDRWEYIRSLFLTALEYTPAERESWLDRLVQEDPLIAGEVTRLLCSYEAADDFLRQPCTLPADLLDNLEPEPYRFSPGDVLCERFRIVHLIGKGGMGEVYKAWDQESEEYVALKTLRLGISTHEVFTSRFRKEPQWGRKVTHTNVCRIHDSFRHQVGGGDFISIVSMELLQGQTLAEHLKEKGRLSADEALPLVRQIISGLGAIHVAGILHRDLKPANLVLVTGAANAAIVDGSPEEITEKKSIGDFQVKITDFGIAGQIPEMRSSSPPSEASKFLGTPDYMAPEQLEHGDASIRSDIYALGLILYQMVTGEKPFAGAAWKRVTSDPPSPCKAAPGLPENWNKTILCCLERNPEHRFQNAQAVLNSLEGTASAADFPPKPLSLRLKRAARSRAGFLAIFFLLSMSFATGIYRYFYQRPEIPPGTMVLVTDIETPDPSLSGITVALKGQLEQSAHFEVVPLEKITAVLKQMDLDPKKSMKEPAAREIALRSGAALLVYGSVVQAGGRYQLLIRVEHPRNPIFSNKTWEQTFTAVDENELLHTAVYNASNWIRNLAGEHNESDLLDRTVEDTTTPSWLALKLYGEAEKKYAAKDPDSALLLLEEAERADPDFAKARMRRADILISRKQYNEGYKEWQIARDLVTTSRHLTNRESFRIEGQYYEDTGNYAEAEKAFGKYQSLYPNDYLAWFYRGSVRDSMDNPKDALADFAEALRLKPDSTTVRAHMAMVYLVIGSYNAARQLTSEIDQLGEHDLATWLSANSAFLEHDLTKALALADMLGSSSSQYWHSRFFMLKARFLAETGQYDAAYATLMDGVKFDRERVDHTPEERASDESDKQIALAYLAYRANDRPSCQQHAREALRLDHSPRQFAEAGALLARAGDVDTVKKLLDELKLYDEGIFRVQFAKLRLQGEKELAMGHPHKARSYFEKAWQAAHKVSALNYPTTVLMFGDTSQYAQNAWVRMVQSPGRLLLYPDNNMPGLWSDAIAQIDSNSIPKLQPETACTFMLPHISLRQNLNAGTQRQFTSIYNQLISLCTANPSYTKERH